MTSERVSPTLGGSFDIDTKTSEVEEIRALVSHPDLWLDPDRATRLTRRLGQVERIVNLVEVLSGQIEDTEILAELAEEENDADTRTEVATELTDVGHRIAELEEESLYFGEYDDYPAILSVHAGAGGVDAQDWAQILFRMYTKYLSEMNLEHEVEYTQPGEEAGVKSAAFMVKGRYAYAALEGERGVHRLVRISPFDSHSRRHTSFAGVDVVPLVENAPVEVTVDDLRIDTYRSQGAGGQHVNTTDSAVRITHLPTGIVVACQAERSQIRNRVRAMTQLKAKLADREREERRREMNQIRGEQTEAGWGHQIRSYVLQPYQIVKDLRTGLEIGNVQGVLNGSLHEFTKSYLHWRRIQHKQPGS